MNAEINDDEETKTPSYIPPSILEKRVKWDVFLSFRGEDTRNEFTSPLRDALKSKGLRPFMDDEGMERGDTIQPSLDEAILDSALAVAIISPNYADSHWCVEELFRIFLCKKRVIPVFYRVDPPDVRQQSGAFGDGFQKLLDDPQKRFGKVEIERWRSALINVGNISGYQCSLGSDNRDEDIQCIVQQVWSELKNTIVELEVGLDFRVNKVVGMLDLAQPDVRFLNIHGTPGIGKTTLAKAIFNKFAMKFKNHCCFISNVTEKLKDECGILSVQNELIKSISSGDVQSLEHVDDGKATIQRIVNQSCVLLVFDDVLEAKQLTNLGIDRGLFHNGSRIIVTSRDVNALLELVHSDEQYEVDKLNELESLELFSIYALGRREPTPDFKAISEEMVSLIGGLPLALEVFGSSLVNKTTIEWKDALKKLKCIDRPHNLEQILTFSYHGLEDQEKVVFLDISCLLLQINMGREDIVDVLAGCGLSPELAIGNLVTKSLLKIRKGNKLWMHDQVRDMGRQIVIEENFDDTGKRSRLWDSMDAMSILRQEKATEAVRGVVLNIKKPPEAIYWYNFRRYLGLSRVKPNEDDKFTLNTKWFEKMKHLKLLRMDYAILQGDFKYMPSDLRWLQWKGCPQKSLPTTMPEELRVLDLSGSNIEHLWSSGRLWWGFNKVVEKLVVLNLSYCPKLAALPDMSRHKHLKKLNLERCVRLSKIHESIGNLSSLVQLNLRGCINLVEFPRDVTGMKGLKELILSDCLKFSELPQDVKSMRSLNRLFLDATAIKKLPETIFHLTQLEVLSLNSCHQLTCLPDCLGSLTFLKELSLSDTKLENLPCSIKSLKHLKILN